jgi:hypothetical protein
MIWKEVKPPPKECHQEQDEELVEPWWNNVNVLFKQASSGLTLMYVSIGKLASRNKKRTKYFLYYVVAFGFLVR